jgi:hypothetical protein
MRELPGLGALYSKHDPQDYSLATVGIDIDPNTAVEETKISYPLKVRNQETTQKCVAFTLSLLTGAWFYKEFGKLVDFAWDFYYGNRPGMDWQGEGMIVKDAVKAAVKYGGVYLSDFVSGPKAADCIADVEAAAAELYVMASAYKPKTYIKLNTIQDIATFIKTFDLPVCIVYDVYWDTAWPNADGIIQEPHQGMIGAHAVTGAEVIKINGYPYVGFYNSWGELWGKKGYGYLPAHHVKEAWGIVNMPPLPDRIDPKTIVLDAISQKATVFSGDYVNSVDTPVHIINGRLCLEVRPIFADIFKFEQIDWDNFLKRGTFKKYKQRL